MSSSFTTVIDGYQRAVQQYPDATALQSVDNEGALLLSLSYQELDLWVNDLISQLLDQGVVPGTRVAIEARRVPVTIALMIAIGKLSAVYVPIDLSHPKTRLIDLMSSSGIGLMVGLEDQLDTINSISAHSLVVSDTPTVKHECPPVTKLEGNDPCYILFTSGSTGLPKPVMIPHKGISRLVDPENTYCQFDNTMHFLQMARLTFDASTFDVWSALANGGCCTIYDYIGLPDPKLLNDIIEKFNINSLFLTTSLFHWIADIGQLKSTHLRCIVTSGEALSLAHAKKMQANLPNVDIVNGYGPTECTTFATCFVLPKKVPDSWQSVPIGYPIIETELYIVDDKYQLVTDDSIGELALAGNGLAMEYVNRPIENEKSFKILSLGGGLPTRVYLTGDLVTKDNNELLHYKGRVDDQVKIAGHRIELDEINFHATHIDGVGQSHTLVVEGAAGAKQIVLCVTTDKAITKSDIIESLQKSIPDFMLPSKVVLLDSMPVNKNGKADRSALRKILENPVDTEAKKSGTTIKSLESNLSTLWCEVLQVSSVKPKDHFFESGGTSLLCMSMLSRAQEYNIPLAVLDVFETPNFVNLLEKLRQRLENNTNSKHSTPNTTANNGPIAVIGMSGRFPGSNNVEEFWSNLLAEQDSLSVFTSEQLDPSQKTLAEDKHYVPVRGLVENSEYFDAEFFGFSAKEAEIADPQLRIFLQEAWRALEHSGYFPKDHNRIGVFAGSGYNGYYAYHVLATYGKQSPLGDLPTQMLNDKDYLSMQTGYRLNLQGPCLSINSACSTSLVAINEAVKSLRLGNTEMAIAGGVSLQTPINSGYIYQEGSMLAQDGKTRPFSADSTGTVFNSGVGVVVLKPLDQAIADNDTIYSVIHGVGLNNDGANKASFSAPSVDGQAAAVMQAINDAGFESTTINFVEAHGTATPLGDPIEVAALTKAFQATNSDDDDQACYLGSVKSNVGHLVSAAGVAGFIKASLALHHRHLPKTLHFSEANPHLNLPDTPFEICHKAVKFAPNETLRAGVSSFGVGGTNAHAVLESYDRPVRTKPVPRPTLFPLSAKTETVMADRVEGTKTFLADSPLNSLVDASFTVQHSRSQFSVRQFFTADDKGKLSVVSPVVDADKNTFKEAVFLFSGQGSQTQNMGRQLYFYQPIFREAADQCITLFNQHLSVDIRDILFSEVDTDTSDTRLSQTEFTQPALFIIEYAMATLWQALGIKPVAFVGHSIGDYVGAVLAGVFSLEDGIAIVAKRGQLMQSMPSGLMLSVRAELDVITPLLNEQCEISVYNGHAQHVVSGNESAISELEAKLTSETVEHTRVKTSHAFHSQSMLPAAEQLSEFISQFTLHPPKTPIVSSCTGHWLSDAEATSADYWGAQLREPVNFCKAINTLKKQHISAILIECGPGKVLSRLAHLSHLGEDSLSVASGIDGSSNEYQQWLTTVGRCWQQGIEIDWSLLTMPLSATDEPPGRVALPTYPFAQKSYWLPAPTTDVCKPVDSQPDPYSALYSNISMPLAPALEQPTSMETTMSVNELITNHIKQLCYDLSGEDVSQVSDDTEFLELGMDSLVLTQVALQIKNHYKVNVPFRRLMQDLGSFSLLSEHLMAEASPDRLPQAQTAPASISTVQASQPIPLQAMPAMPISGGNMQALLAQQLQLISQQLTMLGGEGLAVQQTPATHSPAPSAQAQVAARENIEPSGQVKKTFGAQTKIKTEKIDTSLSEKQQAVLDGFYTRYIEKTKTSKSHSQQYRPVLADPRTASGFTPEMKEITYPLVVKKSHGCRFIDLDDNEYIDVLCGYGSNFFGYSPKAITQAMKDQLDTGIEIGPQTPLAGELATMLADIIPLDRFAFCNTGSEAVMGAMRMARTASGRKKIVMFNGAYHGIVDEVIVREGREHKGLPAAAGILPSSTENIIMLDYGSDEALDVIEQYKDDIAGVLIEPVQSRNPDLQPKEFLHSLRDLTKKHDIAFIMDEVITGFRTCIGGAQAYFGVQADIATYGKVIGGGVSLGVIGGSKYYMDTLDGGFWQYGDESVPEVGVTYFAGTFVRHPLGLAAAKAVLVELKEQGPALQERLNDAAEDFARDLNLYFKYNKLPMHIGQFSSLMYFKFTEESAHGELIFNEMRMRGIHIWYGRPMFFTAAHTDEDIARVKKVFIESIEAVSEMGFDLKVNG